MKAACRRHMMAYTKTLAVPASYHALEKGVYRRLPLTSTDALMGRGTDIVALKGPEQLPAIPPSWLLEPLTCLAALHKGMTGRQPPQVQRPSPPGQGVHRRPLLASSSVAAPAHMTLTGYPGTRDSVQWRLLSLAVYALV